ncbi:MAG TPA: tetratricopeptide repeat-containing glycosyltransferase family protein [Alphaproteobacteria bacterium]|nr:tetratricopeptide repeat-containing glycosyltransferase family protein [Alphaproteobacteria bacterium]
MSELLQKAIGLHQSGQQAAAEAAYRGVLAAKPNDADALALLGALVDATGDHEQAVALIEKAIALDPASPLFRLHLGNALMGVGRVHDAAAAFREAIRLQPALAVAHYNLGNALRNMDDWHGAVAAWCEATRCDPLMAEPYNNIALALVREKKCEEALPLVKRAVALAPGYGPGWLTLCNVAEQLKDYATAVEAGSYAIRLLPDDHRSWFGYGVALNRLDRHEEAIAAYKCALEIKPGRADIWDNLGQTYQSLNRLEEAETTFRKTVEVAGQAITDEEQRLADGRDIDEKEYGNRHWHLALMELLRGKYKEGFARYRARFEDVGELKRPDFSRPLWRGQRLEGKTLLVTDEQGFGDTLMLARYLPILKKQGAKIIFSVHPVLESLFKGWDGADILITHGQPVPVYDYYASIFDVPHRLGTTLSTVPANVPYLPLPVPPPDMCLPDDAKKKVGIVWSGSRVHGNDARRSIPLAVFAGLFAGKAMRNRMRFYSFNHDARRGDASILAQHQVIDLAPRLRNFADSACFVQQCDLIITCDTAMAHLAGGMGKRVWTLLPFAPDWRWLTERGDSPWYPTMWLFRQRRIGDWAGVIKRTGEALAAWLGP